MKSVFCTTALLLLTALAPGKAHAQDRLTMKNGDIISGKISVFTESSVTIQPQYASAAMEVNLGEVSTVDIEEGYFEVELTDGTQLAGRVAMDAQGQQVLVLEDGSERPIALSDIAAAGTPQADFAWGLNADFNATLNDGNTDSRNTLLFFDGNLRDGDHRHRADLTFRREEQNGISVKEQDLFNYAYNWIFNDPWFTGASFSFERDPIRALDYRYTIGGLVGRDLFNDDRKRLSFSVGVGYSEEEIGGVKEDGLVGLWDLRYEHRLYTGVDFFHNHHITQQFYGEDNLIFKSNTGIRLDLVKDLYASVSLRYDYETEPAPGRSKDDSTLAVGVGYAF